MQRRHDQGETSNAALRDLHPQILRGGDWSRILTPATPNRVNPATYLGDILSKIADGHRINKIDALLPWQAEYSS
jgi:hypothetical protein